MSTTTPQQSSGLVDELVGFLRDYYAEEIGTLAQRFPSEQTAIEVAYSDLDQAQPDIAERLHTAPDDVQQYLDDALRQYDLPADVGLGGATVRVVDLPEHRTHYPGHYSPTEYAGEYLAVKGEVVLASDVRPKVTESAFECERCGTMTYIPQTDAGFQEPHECQGCERQGPFRVNFDQSEFVDAQTLRVQEPPSVAGGGGRDISVMLEGELCDEVGIGDEIVVPGTLHLKQQTQGNSKQQTFLQYLDAAALEIEETDYRSLDITSEERERIRALADGAEGDPLDVAAESLSTKILGHDHIKRAIILALVGGQQIVGEDGSMDRGDFHILLLGDPGTAKSKLGDRAEQIAPRAVGVSGKNATEAGLTASATRDELNDNQWTLDPGAYVKANGGLVWVDELDDMPADVRASMLEPMSKQTINVNKAGINATLSTEAAVIAAGNPKYGRFDPYEPTAEQFEFDSALLSRFDLIYTLSDKPDSDRDLDIARHVAEYREHAKRSDVAPETVDDADAAAAQPPVDSDTLAKWVALAKQQPAPLVEDDAVLDEQAQSFAQLRGANGYDHESPIPVTFRKWEAVLRIAEAAAKFELSETVEERHFETAMDLVGRSMSDYGKDEDGQFDADVVETGQSKKATQLTKLVEDVLTEEHDGEVLVDQVIEDVLEERSDITESSVENAIEELYNDGYVTRPEMNGDDASVKWMGRY
jgi:replicative DNA helicase Mcm